MATKAAEKAIESLVILVADSNPFTRPRLNATTAAEPRRSSRSMRSPTGSRRWEAIRSVSPDVLIVDWDMMVVWTAREVTRIVR